MTKGTYVGLILSIFCPLLLFTNSPLIYRPSGCLYLRPFGAVSSVKRSEDMVLRARVCVMCSMLCLLTVRIDSG